MAFIKIHRIRGSAMCEWCGKSPLHSLEACGDLGLSYSSGYEPLAWVSLALAPVRLTSL